MRFPLMCIKENKEGSRKTPFLMGTVAPRMSGASADWVHLHQEICLGNIRYSPVWNFLGETEAFLLTFYAKK